MVSHHMISKTCWSFEGFTTNTTLNLSGLSMMSLQVIMHSYLHVLTMCGSLKR